MPEEKVGEMRKEIYCEKESGFKDWIRPVKGDDSKALCRYFQCDTCTSCTRSLMRILYSMQANDKRKRNAALFSSTRLMHIGFTISKQNESIHRSERNAPCMFAELFEMLLLGGKVVSREISEHWT